MMRSEARLSRRGFVALVPALSVPLLGRAQDSSSVTRTMFGPMDESQYRPVRLPPKTVNRAALDAEQRNAVEHQLKCLCGCTLDVYTCRTTDFACPVSPAMHADVMALVGGGYAANEIRAAFVKVYGERVLMAPTRSGFNLVGYFLPFVVLAIGGIVVTRILRVWTTRRRPLAAPSGEAQPESGVSAEEFSAIEREVRRDP